MIREQLYNLEAERRSAIVKGDCVEWSRVQGDMAEIGSDSPIIKFPDSDAFRFVQRARIPKEVILAVSQSNPGELQWPVDAVIDKCRSFVSDEFAVDLGEVEIVRVKDDYILYEGLAVSCRDTEHLVVLPPVGEGFEAPDLLVHEFGHTAEFNLRRSLGDDKLLVHHRLFSETVAHYCQYRYLLEFGTREERLGAMGSVTKEYLALKAVLLSIELGHKELAIREVCSHKNMADFTEVYGQDKIANILSGYSRLSLAEIYHYHVEPRFGAILAMRLINEADLVKRLSLASPEKPIHAILQDMGLEPDSLLDFECVGDLVWDFVGG